MFGKNKNTYFQSTVNTIMNILFSNFLSIENIFYFTEVLRKKFIFLIYLRCTSINRNQFDRYTKIFPFKYKFIKLNNSLKCSISFY